MKHREIAPFLILAATLMAGCGSQEEALSQHAQPLLSENGVSKNGLALNGLSTNGFAWQGFAWQGLTVDGLEPPAPSDDAFTTWFHDADGGDVALHASVMKYVTACALAAGRTVTFTDRALTTHRWEGKFGLADSWADAPATDEQKQWVSACLMAHVNTALPNPRSIQISLRGDAPGLATTLPEGDFLAVYDGVFFGDLFSSPQRRYVCGPVDPQSTYLLAPILREWGRDCYRDPGGCGLFTRVDCDQVCTGSAFPGAPPTVCSVDGSSYRPISVHVPRVTFARQFVRTHSTLTACSFCADGVVIDRLSAVSSAKAPHSTSEATDVTVEIRYLNGWLTKSKEKQTAYLRIEVNGTPVMNGTSDLWDFAWTGWETLGSRLVRVHLPRNGTITIRGSSGVPAPRVNYFSYRL